MSDIELIEQFRTSKNKNAFSALYSKYKNIISKIEKNIIAENFHFLKEDGKYILFLAINDFDKKKNDNFKNYLCQRVKWFYLNAINKEINLRQKHSFFNNHSVNYEDKLCLREICEEKNLKILVSKFFVGKSLTEISKDLSCSKSQITKLFKKELQVLEQNI